MLTETTYSRFFWGDDDATEPFLAVVNVVLGVAALSNATIVNGSKFNPDWVEIAHVTLFSQCPSKRCDFIGWTISHNKFQLNPDSILTHPVLPNVDGSNKLIPVDVFAFNTGSLSSNGLSMRTMNTLFKTNLDFFSAPNRISTKIIIVNSSKAFSGFRIRFSNCFKCFFSIFFSHDYGIHSLFFRTAWPTGSTMTPIQCGGELMDFLLNMDVNHQEEKKLYNTLFDLLSLKKTN